MITINECLVKILENLIKSDSTHTSGRPLTYEIKHYISVIFKVLSTGCQWNSLTEKLHYTVYHKHFLKWCNLGIFKKLNEIISIMVSKFKKINNDCYIDTTIIRNIGGIEDISHNYKIKSKRGTKVSIIVNSKGIPLSIHVVNSNYHDVTLVLPTFYKINKKIKIKNLIGDKGYISAKMRDFLMKKHNVKYYYPSKNKVKENEETAIKLKSRMINENSFSWMTQYRRLTK